MTLLIQTTGLEQYAPGGSARVKVLMIGGPGVGKTRWASFFPKPIYADCEKGLASVADRKVPYVTIRNSEDMLALLQMLKTECGLPPDKRRFETVVVDTLDAFARKLKDEWLLANRKQSFSGFEAWGFLNSRLQMLMTRLLNLDMNVVVNCHFKDRTTRDDETGKETHTFQVQLQGEAVDTVYNDFDLCGWMGTFFEAVDGERVQKRGITFQPVPDKPFLKDRLNATPKWMEVTFTDEDYTSLFRRIQERVEEMGAGEVIGEVPTDLRDEASSRYVVPPGAAGSGPLPAPRSAPDDAPSGPRVPYAQMDRPTLQKLAREAGVTTQPDGTPLKGNSLKAEYVAAMEAHARAQTAATTAETTTAAGQAQAAEAAQPAPAEPLQLTRRVSEPERRDAAQASAGQVSDEPGREVAAKVANPRRARAVPPPPASGPGSEAEPKDVSALSVVGEDVAMHAAVELVQQELGATAPPGAVAAADKPADKAADQPAEKPAEKPFSKAPERPVAKADAGNCEECGKSLEGENADFVKLSWIKYRKRLCENDYQSRKGAR